MKKKVIQKNNYKKGITLFVAVLVASVATLFSFAISDIALREVLLAQTGKDSQEAFFAANSGIECALFWDLKKGIFTPDTEGPIICNENTGTSVDMDRGLNGEDEVWSLSENSNVEFAFFDGDGEKREPCFVIDSVIKEVDKEGGETVSILTEIIVKGYNTCDTESPRRLERAIRIEY